MFTQENTEGFTSEQIEMLNEALETLSDLYPDVDERDLSDRINNAWIPEITVEQLVSKCKF